MISKHKGLKKCVCILNFEVFLYTEKGEIDLTQLVDLKKGGIMEKS